MQNASRLSSLTNKRLAVQAHHNFAPMIAVNAAAATVATWTCLGVGWVGWWYGAVLILSAIRLAGWWRFREEIKAAGEGDSEPSDEAVMNWRSSYSLGLYAAGTFWAILCVMANPVVTQQAMFTNIVIVCGLAGGAPAVTAPMLLQGRIYIALLLLPASISLLFLSTPEPLIACLGLTALVVMTLIHKNNYMMVVRSLLYREQNTSLVEDLRALNASLESKVAVRTRELRELVHKDNLTGLLNRRGLLNWLDDNFDAQDSREGAVLFLDLDRFKQINDAMGHTAGDKVLEIVAFRLRQSLPEDAVLARWGGDEFVIALPQQYDIRRHSDELTRALLDSLMLPLQVNEQSMGVGLSIGISYFPTDSKRYEDVIQAADLAMAEVKKAGRGRALEFSKTYAEIQRRRFDLSRALGAAIKTDKLELHYQPIIHSKTGRVASLEALCRWEHPILGRISPEEFIPLAEDTDRIVSLGDWVLRTACADAAGWDEDVSVAVNVSVRQLLSSDFTRRVSRILAKAGLPPHRLELEVTESLFDEENTSTMLRVVNQLRQRGIAVHIDDFGTGYSSLSRLLEFPVSAIKIDKSFVACMHDQGAVIIESAVMIAKRFNFKVIAEGVETEQQAQALSRMGIDYFQGYAFGRPDATPKMGEFSPVWLKGEQRRATG